MSDKKKFMSVRVDDIIRVENKFWIVCGVYLGTVEQEDLIGLKSLTSKPVDIHGKNHERLVPIEFFYAQGVIRYRTIDDKLYRDPKIKIGV
jgi:hypothetical protein